ncbi:carbohydrate kinase family protein [Fodinibius sediminis]|uniref:Sugar or nucleoside kinase, ribokinase family n=1 Tax=Fodinibius sediminis TaxID=1214077 RepID=A0A521C0C9_9BACT|nr:sugar kinase [Fodinibius sediminis]SMO52844.1 Sugar or nucleoside kinase, ribokinase family [Fodinibius sediminis]
MSTSTPPQKDLLVIGELNMDLILDDVQSFPELGKEKIAGDLNLTLGSSSAIFAGNSSRLGLAVAFCGMIGDDDFGKTIIPQLQEYGVDTSLITVTNKYKTGLTAIIRYADDRAMVTYPGAMEHFALADIPEEAFGQARHMHISSIFLQPGIKEDLPAIIDRASSAGMTISIDTQWDPEEHWDLDFEHLLSRIDFFLPNEDEFLNMTGSSSVEEAIDRFQPYLTDGTVIIKQGTRGATYFTSDTIKSIPGYTNPDPVDTVGAGDSFNAGVIYRFLQGDPLERCIKFGNITGAVSTTAPGGTQALTSLNDILHTAKNKLSITDSDDFTS